MRSARARVNPASWSLLLAHLADEGNLKGGSSRGLCVGRGISSLGKPAAASRGAPGVPTCGRHQSELYADTDSVLRTLGDAQGHVDVMVVIWSCVHIAGHPACPLLLPFLRSLGPAGEEKAQRDSTGLYPELGSGVGVCCHGCPGRGLGFSVPVFLGGGQWHPIHIRSPVVNSPGGWPPSHDADRTRRSSPLFQSLAILEPIKGRSWSA